MTLIAVLRGVVTSLPLGSGATTTSAPKPTPVLILARCWRTLPIWPFRANQRVADYAAECQQGAIVTPCGRIELARRIAGHSNAKTTSATTSALGNVRELGFRASKRSDANV